MALGDRYARAKKRGHSWAKKRGQAKKRGAKKRNADNGTTLNYRDSRCFLGKPQRVWSSVALFELDPKVDRRKPGKRTRKKGTRKKGTRKKGQKPFLGT